MRLYLAVAVLMLAFVAYTEAQEETVEQKVARFGEQFSEIAKSMVEKAKTAYEEIQTSETVSKANNWFQEKLEALKAKIASQ